VNSIAKAIASLKRTKGHVDQATNQIPVQEDDPCYRCDHMKIFVFLVTCCDATVCENCADEMAWENKTRKFLLQLIDGSKDNKISIKI